MVNDADLESSSLDSPGSAELQTFDPIDIPDVMNQWVHIIKTVVESGQHNKDQCKIVVNNTWNFELLQSLLIDYHDSAIIDFLKYGWPISRDADAPLEMGGVNHKGATNYPEHVDAYVEKEQKLGATIGPFECIPFKSHVGISPLSTRRRTVSLGESSWIVVGHWG